MLASQGTRILLLVVAGTTAAAYLPSAAARTLAARAATPIFVEPATDYVLSATLHLQCATPDARIYYTLDGTAPVTPTASASGAPSSPSLAPGSPLFVDSVGSTVIRAVAAKKGMADSAEATETIVIMDRVAAPRLTATGEQAQQQQQEEQEQPSGGVAYLRSAVIKFDCATAGASILYTTDDGGSQEVTVAPGTTLRWGREGTTVFRARAEADGMYPSAAVSLAVTVVLPPYDTFPVSQAVFGNDVWPQMATASLELLPLADGSGYGNFFLAGSGRRLAPPSSGSSSSSSSSNTSSSTTAGATLPLPPLHGAAVRLFNPSGHLSLIGPLGMCGAEPSRSRRPRREDEKEEEEEEQPARAAPLGLPSQVGAAFVPLPATVNVPSGADTAALRESLDLDDKEAAWNATGGAAAGCRAGIAAGLLLLPSSAAAAAQSGQTSNGGCAGHVVANGRIVQTDPVGHELVSFGVRGGSFVIGHLSEDDVRHSTQPFDLLLAGTSWLVRDAVLPPVGSAAAAAMVAEGAVTGAVAAAARVARSAVGHDVTGALLLVQVDGAATDGNVEGGLNATEFAQLLLGLGAVNAVHLAAGAAATLTRNNAVVSAPSGSCEGTGPADGAAAASSGAGNATSAASGGGGGAFFRCEQPAPALLCLHGQAPPRLVVPEAANPTAEPAAAAASSAQDDDPDDPAHFFVAEDRGQGQGSLPPWGQGPPFEVEGMCANGTANETLNVMWLHLTAAEQDTSRFRLAVWVLSVVCALSLLVNVQQMQRLAHAEAVNRAAGYASSATCALMNGSGSGGLNANNGSRRSRRRGKSGGSGGGFGYSKVSGHGDGDSRDFSVEFDVPTPLAAHARGAAVAASNSNGQAAEGGRFERFLGHVRGGRRSAPSGNEVEMGININPFQAGEGSWT